MKYQPFWCNIDHKMANIDQNGECRPMHCNGRKYWPSGRPVESNWYFLFLTSLKTEPMVWINSGLSFLSFLCSCFFLGFPPAPSFFTPTFGSSGSLFTLATLKFGTNFFFSDVFGEPRLKSLGALKELSLKFYFWLYNIAFTLSECRQTSTCS